MQPTARTILHDVFGFSEFKPGQEQIIETGMQRLRDAETRDASGKVILGLMTSKVGRLAWVRLRAPGNVPPARNGCSFLRFSLLGTGRCSRLLGQRDVGGGDVVTYFVAS